jgi:hypothetical protein
MPCGMSEMCCSSDGRTMHVISVCMHGRGDITSLGLYCVGYYVTLPLSDCLHSSTHDHTRTLAIKYEL